MKHLEVEVTERGFNCKEKNLNFIYSATLNWCGDKIFSTVEGVYTVLGKSLDALAFFSVINYSLAYSIKSKRS